MDINILVCVFVLLCDGVECEGDQIDVCAHHGVMAVGEFLCPIISV